MGGEGAFYVATAWRWATVWVRQVVLRVEKCGVEANDDVRCIMYR